MSEQNKNSEAVVISAMVMPAVSADEAVKQWHAYQTLKDRVKTKEDIQVIQGKEFLKKSYWRKIARFFNLSIEIVQEERENLGENWVAYHFKARAIAPNGAFAEGVGSCDNREKGITKSIHNTRTIAETRAWNRAVSNLVGAGEVSAEEMVEENGNNNGSRVENKSADKTYTMQNPSAPMTEAQKRMIFKLEDEKNITHEAVKQYLASHYDIGRTTGINKQQASELIDALIKDKVPREVVSPGQTTIEELIEEDTGDGIDMG